MLPAAGPRALLAPAAAAAALVAASGWLAEPRVGYLAVCLLATAVAVFATIRFTPAAMRVPLGLVCVSLIVMCALAARSQQRLASFSSAPAVVGAEEAASQRTLLKARVDDELLTLRQAAMRALSVTGVPSDVVSRLENILGETTRRSVLILRADTLMAWAGTLHADPHTLSGQSGVVATPFGLTLYVAADSAGVRVVTTSLLYAAPPADRLTRGLAQRLPSSEVSEGFTFAPPTDSAGPDALRYADGGRPLFIARALLPSVEEVRFRMLERARVRVGVALLVALIALVVTASRFEAGALATFGAVLVVLRCIAVIPLSEFSTRSRLFDAAVYFFPAGLAFTANAAALAITSATLLLTVLLVVRRTRSSLPRVVGAAIAIAGSLLGPYFVRTLSRGIAPPAEGAGAALWAIWEIPLCLAATTLLVLAAWGGRAALGGRRGVDPTAAPALASLRRSSRRSCGWRPDSGRRGMPRCGHSRSARSSRRDRAVVGSSRPPPSPRSAPRRWCGAVRHAGASSWPSATCAV